METRRIKIEDIRANENNPRTDFGDLDLLWQTFSFNSENPGEPVNPIVVVQDGNIYRIVDGERRFRAMRDHGQESCMAVVCTGYDDMAQAVQMLATDDKLSLTAEEAGRGIQQMLLLGVDDTKVAAVSHANVDTVATVRNYLDAIRSDKEPNKLYQASLDQLLAASQMDEAGEEEAAAKLLESRNWQSDFANFKRKQDHQNEYNALVQAAKDAGFEILPEEFDAEEYGAVGYVYGTADAFAEKYAQGFRYTEIKLAGWGANAHVYMPKGQDPCKTPEEQEAAEKRAEADAAREEAEARCTALRADVAKWFIERIYLDAPTVEMDALKTLCRRALFGEDEESGLLGNQIRSFAEEFDWDPELHLAQLPAWARARAFLVMYPESMPNYSTCRALGVGIEEINTWSVDIAADGAAELCGVINGFIAAGYKPPAWADELMREVEAISRFGKQDDEEEVE